MCDIVNQPFSVKHFKNQCKRDHRYTKTNDLSKKGTYRRCFRFKQKASGSNFSCLFFGYVLVNFSRSEHNHFTTRTTAGRVRKFYPEKQNLARDT